MRVAWAHLSADEQALLAGIAACPWDAVRHGVYADWLDERGRHDEATAHRVEWDATYRQDIARGRWGEVLGGPAHSLELTHFGAALPPGVTAYGLMGADAIGKAFYFAPVSVVASSFGDVVIPRTEVVTKGPFARLGRLSDARVRVELVE